MKKVEYYNLVDFYNICKPINEIAENLTIKNDSTETIKQYHYGRIEDRVNLGYDAVGPEDYYCVKDINSDGIEELVISEYPDENIISGLYTICNGKVENVFRQERHGRNYIISNSYIEYHYKTIYIDKLRGKETENVYTSSSAFVYVDQNDKTDVYDVMEHEFEQYKIDNGFSTEYMSFNFIPYHIDELSIFMLIC